jgi:hypothetical protein
MPPESGHGGGCTSPEKKLSAIPNVFARHNEKIFLG